MLKFREFRTVIEFRDLYRSHERRFLLKFSKIKTISVLVHSRFDGYASTASLSSLMPMVMLPPSFSEPKRSSCMSNGLR